MTMFEDAKDGAIGAAAPIGGSLVLGPTLGAPIAGMAADQFTDSEYGFTEAGVAIGLYSLISGGSATTSATSTRGRK